PDGKHFIYLRLSSDASLAGIYTASLDTKPTDPRSKRLLATGSQAVFVPSVNSREERFVFFRQGTLMTQPFHSANMELTGDPVPIAEQVGISGAFAAFSVSPNGILAYHLGASTARQLTWFDRKGTVLGHVGDPGPYREIELSPDVKRAATYLQGNQTD